MNEDRINNYINNHPRECLYLLLIGSGLIWQTVPSLLSILVYLFLIQKKQFPIWLVASIGLLLFIFGMYIEQGDISVLSLAAFIKSGFVYNKSFLTQLFSADYVRAWNNFYHHLFSYVVSLPFVMAAGLGIIDLIPKSAHAQKIQDLQKGIMRSERQELPDKKITLLLEKITEQDANGTVLGVSKYTGSCVTIPDKNVNQVALVLGTTGGGKTITLRRFYQRAITKNYPLIIVDGKPDVENIEWIAKLAECNRRQFYGFNCGNYRHYDPLADGGYTELKDKIISLKDNWENDYYRSIAEDYLQTTFEVLLKSGEAIDLKKVVECLNYIDLQDLARRIKNDELIKRVASLEQYNREDITGLQAHLNILVHSELGQYFLKDESTFRLKKIIESGGVVYFALPALRFPSFSKVLGKLVINDLKAIIDRHDNSQQKIFTIFDEFSVFAGEQVLNLVNMGRGKGVHAVFGTQGIADLDKVDATFKSQLLNCTNTLICHRLNDKNSAEDVANWIGTNDKFNVTAQVNLKEEDAGLGSVRASREFIVHPDEIKQDLQAGEAFYVTKVGQFFQDKIKIKYHRHTL